MCVYKVRLMVVCWLHGGGQVYDVRNLDDVMFCNNVWFSGHMWLPTAIGSCTLALMCVATNLLHLT